jgi:dTDP-4-dehydrorhamnose 3,5-epimerase
MQFRDGTIDGIIARNLAAYRDQRGWLIEIFRQDEIDAGYAPVMAYISETLPGVVRGPHEHVDQSDLFGFIGPSTFAIYLWDSRKSSPTCGVRTKLLAGAEAPMTVIVPPGVVHAYKNIGSIPGWVLNCPNRLYRGPGKSEPVDEIRHEEIADSPYIID